MNRRLSLNFLFISTTVTLCLANGYSRVNAEHIHNYAQIFTNSSSDHISHKFMTVNKTSNDEDEASIQYHYGRILSNPIPVNIVYYGESWPSSRRAIIQDFIKSLTASGDNSGGERQKAPTVRQWWNINREYFDKSKKYVSSNIHLKSVLLDPKSSMGKSLASGSVVSILKNAFAKNKLKPSSAAINLVLTGPKIRISGFCTSWCGMHSSFKYKNIDIVYSVVGNPESLCAHDCSMFGYLRRTPPNRDMGVDSMVNIIGHVLAESVTDPNLNAWYHSDEDDYYGWENGDFCNFHISVLRPSNKNKLGSVVYTHRGINGRNFLIQDVFSRRKGRCVAFSA